MILGERPGRGGHGRTAAQTWSSWYNQPTGQFYHVVTDNRFPVLGLRRAAGLAARRACPAATRLRRHRSCSATCRAIDGRRRERQHRARPEAIPNVIFGGRVERLDLRHAQTRTSIPTLAYPDDLPRATWTLPLAFSPRDPRVLYFAQPAPLPHGRRRRALDDDQPRPDARGPGRPAEPRPGDRGEPPPDRARAAA